MIELHKDCAIDNKQHELRGYIYRRYKKNIFSDIQLDLLITVGILRKRQVKQ